MNHQQTLVTCLFDLERRERSGRRPIDFYRRHAGLVLDLERPLVAYAEPELAGWLREARRERGLAALTRVVERPLEALPRFADTPLIASFPTFANGDPAKDTPLHQVVEWSKFDLLEETLAVNPFATEHFAWIDFGLGHVAELPLEFPTPSRRVAVLQMRATAPAETVDREAFLSYERSRIAGGFMRGDRAHLASLIECFRAELASVLAARFRPNEQMLLAYLAAQRPDLFDYYYGDYPSILRNWDKVRGGVGTVLLNLVHCRNHDLWPQAQAIAEATLASSAEGCLDLTADQYAQLLDEAFIAAWHAGRRDRAAHWRRILLAGARGSAYFETHRERILANLEWVLRIDPM